MRLRSILPLVIFLIRSLTTSLRELVTKKKPPISANKESEIKNG